MLEKKYDELEKLVKDENLKDIITQHLISYWKYLEIRKNCDKGDAIKFFINDEKGKVDFIDVIEKKILQLQGKRVLDVGCGKGGLVISCALRGGEVFGFDIDDDELKIAKLRIKSYGIDNCSIINGEAENIPFPDNTFDMVIATSVLEHVHTLDKVIEEMVRVTKLDGWCCTTTPNPLFPREGHYKVFYVPYMPKWLGKIYLRFRGFNPDFFINHVTYPYPSISKIEKKFKEEGMEVTNITERDILIKFKEPSLIVTERIRNVVNVLKKLRLNYFIAKFIYRFHPYPGVFVVAKKGDSR